MDFDNFMVMPDYDYDTDWDREDEIWAEKEDEAWEDIRDNNFKED